MPTLGSSKKQKLTLTQVKFSSENAYKGLKLAKVPEASEETIQVGVDEIITARRKELGKLQESQTGIGIQLDSHCILDITGRHLSAAGEVGEPILPVCQEGVSLDMQEAEKILPGFVSHIVGCKGGDSKMFDLEFPSDWPSEGLRGQKARFQVCARTCTVRQKMAMVTKSSLTARCIQILISR